jgi:hypothetical protein
MPADDDMTRLTVRVQSNTLGKLRKELSHLNSEAARIRFLAQFYLDYKEMEGQPMPVKRPAECSCGGETDTQNETDES